MIVAERGVHTVELYLRNMGYSAIQRIVDDLYEQEKIYLRKKDKIKNHCDYEVTDLFPDGIYMKLEQRYLHSPGGIRFIVNPTHWHPVDMFRRHCIIPIWIQILWRRLSL